MPTTRSIRDELERTAEEATYLAVGLGLLAVRELRRRRRRAPEPPAPSTLLDELSALAQPMARELWSLADVLGRLARDAMAARGADAHRA